ncbi:MAG: hypothetical protein A2284_18690 [Deltaproteobacteria bacterium RIFOXYA12_FULL_61_11]|nr:MAG: hypothetical protein A2284_18690 [Deltaproteobacteria bacterium RIFOXYA12_FULL_61_11]
MGTLNLLFLCLLSTFLACNRAPQIEHLEHELARQEGFGSAPFMATLSSAELQHLNAIARDPEAATARRRRAVHVLGFNGSDEAKDLLRQLLAHVELTPAVGIAVVRNVARVFSGQERLELLTRAAQQATDPRLRSELERHLVPPPKD